MDSISEVHLYTKDARVFSHTVPGSNASQVDGYSLDLTRRILANVGLGATPTYVHVLDGNAAILGQNGSGIGLAADHCNPQVSPNTLCIGAAALAITAEREAAYDFTAPYYHTTLRLMVPAAASQAKVVTVRILEVLVGALLVCLAFLGVMTPLVWAAEMLTARWTTAAALAEAAALPIFAPGEDRSDFVLRDSLLAAARYTVRTFLGARLPRPHSKVAARMLVPILTEFKGLVALVTTAALAATFARDVAASGGDVRAVSDLVGMSVCSNVDAAATSAVVAELAYVHSFRVMAHPDTTSTFDAYFASECDALIYDEPLLQAELRARRQATAQADAAYARVHASALVGEAVDWTPYALAMNEAHPLRKEINLALLAMTSNRRVRADLHARWLHVPASQTPRADDRIFGGYLEAWAIPMGATAATIALIGVGAFAVLARSRSRLVEVARQPASDRSLVLMRARHEGLTPADLALTSTHALVHEMATSIRAIDQSVHRMASEQTQVLTVVANTKKMPTLLVQNV